MRTFKRSKPTWTRLLAATTLLWLALSASGCVPPKPSPVIVVPDSRAAFLGEPNQPATAPWPYVVISRWRYHELIRCEMTLRKQSHLEPRP